MLPGGHRRILSCGLARSAGPPRTPPRDAIGRLGANPLPNQGCDCGRTLADQRGRFGGGGDQAESCDLPVDFVVIGFDMLSQRLSRSVADFFPSGVAQDCREGSPDCFLFYHGLGHQLYLVRRLATGLPIIAKSLGAFERLENVARRICYRRMQTCRPRLI